MKGEPSQRSGVGSPELKKMEGQCTHKLEPLWGKAKGIREKVLTPEMGLPILRQGGKEKWTRGSLGGDAEGLEGAE